MTFPFGQPITIRKRTLSGTTDAYGDDVYTVTTETVTGVFVPPTAFMESTGDAVSQPMVFLPPDVTDVSWVDAVQLGSAWDDAALTYEVDGVPAVWGPNPFTGRTSGVEVRLKAAIRGRSTT